MFWLNNEVKPMKVVNLMNNQYMRENEVCVCVFFNLLNGLVDLDLLIFLDL